jgi:phospholipase/carboxylesterase
MVDILKGPSITKHQNPKKLMIMLHGYGDNATNFIQIANLIDQDDWGMKYIALNAPDTIQDYPMGYEWFQLYLNGTHISNASAKEYDVVKNKISKNIEKIYNSISLLLENSNLNMSDCFVMGFSQGGMMAFELGKILQKHLAGLAIISSRIISKEHEPNNAFLKTPIFISHGGRDAVLPISNYNESIEVLKNYNYNYENYLIEKDEHTMSQETITLFQNFIKKNI